MNHEIELKLILPRKLLPSLRRHPLVAGAAKIGQSMTLDNTYFDTADMALQKQKIALRIRRHRRRQLQTVKCASVSTGGLSSRPEWEQPFSGTFDFSNVASAKVRKLLRHHQAELTAVFSTRFKRETRRYRADDGGDILLMIDTGEVSAAQRRAPICELELELQQGEPRDLLRLACRLAETLPLLPSDISKAERGYRLYAEEAAPLSPDEKSVVTARQSPHQAFLSLAHFHIRQWQSHVEGAVEQEKPRIEALHRLYLSQRRLIALLQLFAPILPVDFTNAWRERLELNAQYFGRLRAGWVTWDTIVRPVSDIDRHDSHGLAPLRTVAQRYRDETLRQCDLSGQGKLILGLMLALEELRPTAPAIQFPLAKFAATTLAKLEQEMADRLRDTEREATEEKLRTLCAAVGDVAYALRCFSRMLPRQGGKKRLGKLKKIRDALSYLQDVDTAASHFAAWTAAEDSLAVPAAFVCGRHALQYLRQRRRAVKKLKRLLRTE